LITLAQALNQSTEALIGVSDTPLLDAQTLLAHRLGKSRSWILTHPEECLSETVTSDFMRDIEVLKMGVPLPYVLGHWEFFGLDFILTTDTLIPRPETELLVEQAVSWLDRHPERRLAADLGTGSGCIAVSLTKVKPDLSVFATDISYPALKVARRNSSQHNVGERVHFLQADLFPPIARRFDLVFANLPYIPTQTLQTLKVFKREPILALDGGPNGLDLIGRFLESAPDHISPGGFLIIEIDSSQGAEVQRLAQRAFPSSEISVKQDLSRHDRLVTIELPEFS
jgi:release factor glutamine methyltransferase